MGKLISQTAVGAAGTGVARDEPISAAVGRVGTARLRVVPIAAVLVAATAVGLAIALTNQPYHDLLNRWLQVEGELGHGLVFSSYLLLIGGAVVIWSPARFGVRIGLALARWRLVAGVIVGVSVVTAAILALVPPIPYADALWVNEVVVVPLTEELVFRAAMLTAIVAALVRLGVGRHEVVAIAINAVAFGVAHAANLTSLDAAFVLPQVVFATALGAVCAFVAIRTQSVFPAVLVHAAVNLVVVVS